MNMNEDKMKSLLDMLDHTEQYTDAEMECILNDNEALAIYETIVMVKQALQPTGTQETRFLQHQTTIWKAASVAILFVVGVLCYAAFHFIGGQSYEELSAPTSPIAISQAEKEEANKEKEGVAIPKTVIFENKTLREVLAQMSDTYKVNVRYKEEGLANLRLYFNWNPSEDIHDVLTLLNSFEHFHLELEGNTIVVSQ